MLRLIPFMLMATAAVAAPDDTRTTMTLPAAGGYLQPGNPNRGITAVGAESALVRTEQKATTKARRSVKTGAKQHPGRSEKRPDTRP